MYKLFMRNGLVAVRGLGLCSQGIYSLATASQMDCFAWVRQFVAASILNWSSEFRFYLNVQVIYAQCLSPRPGTWFM